jgi:hypothetical protein
MNMAAELYPGRSGLTLGAVSDRLALCNMLSAYAHYAAAGELEKWAALFHHAAIFTVSTPDSPGRSMGMSEVLNLQRPLFAQYHKIYLDRTVGEMKAYEFTHPFILSQSQTRLDFLRYMTELRFAIAGLPPRVHMAATYEGELVKESEDWKITRWTITTAQRPPPGIVSPWFPQIRASE